MKMGVWRWENEVGVKVGEIRVQGTLEALVTCLFLLQITRTIGSNDSPLKVKMVVGTQ